MNLYAYVANDPVNGVDPTGLCNIEPGSRICQGDGTIRVKSETIAIRYENGNLNSSLAAQTVRAYTAESIARTEESGFTREHGVTLSVDEEAQAYVVTLFQGPEKDFFGAGSLKIEPTDRRLLYSVHTHTALGIEGATIPNILSNWFEGGVDSPGPSSEVDGPINDLQSAHNWRNTNNPNAKFGVIFRTPNLDDSYKWNYEAY